LNFPKNLNINLLMIAFSDGCLSLQSGFALAWDGQRRF